MFDCQWHFCSTVEHIEMNAGIYYYIEYCSQYMYNAIYCSNSVRLVCTVHIRCLSSDCGRGCARFRINRANLFRCRQKYWCKKSFAAQLGIKDLGMRWWSLQLCIDWRLTELCLSAACEGHSQLAFRRIPSYGARLAIRPLRLYPPPRVVLLLKTTA